MAVDAAMLGIGGIELAKDRWDLVEWTYLAYSLGSPIVHAAHDRWGIAGASFGVHFLVPLGFIGLTVGAGEGRSIGTPEYRTAMMTAGFLFPTIIDAAFFSRENPTLAAAPAGPTILSIAPTLDRTSVGGSVAGTF